MNFVNFVHLLLAACTPVLSLRIRLSPSHPKFVHIMAKYGRIMEKYVSNEDSSCVMELVDVEKLYPENQYQPFQHDYESTCKAKQQHPKLVEASAEGIVSLNSKEKDRVAGCEILQDEHIDHYGRVSGGNDAWQKWYPAQTTVNLTGEIGMVRCEYCNLSAPCKSNEYSHYITAVRQIPVFRRAMDSVQKERHNIILVVLESTSDSTVQRLMRATYNNLTSLGFTRFQMHTRVGENTFPNLGALLTGQHMFDKMGKRTFPNHEFWDDKPLLWKDMKSLGYVTSFNEEVPELGAFEYTEKGFRDQPTDQFGHKFGYTWRKNVPNSKKNHYGGYGGWCLGGETSTNTALDHVAAMAERYAGSPSTSPLWLTLKLNYYHDGLNPSHMDFHAAATVRRIYEAAGRNSLIVLMGDHGRRWGATAKDANHPALFVRLPDRLVHTFPEASELLVKNSQQLTTPLDVYELVQDIAHSDQHEALFRSSSPPAAYGSGYGMSLLRKLPSGRSCKDAGIPLQFCPCMLLGDEVPIGDAKDLVRNLAGSVVEFVHKELAPNSELCMDVSLGNVTSLHKFGEDYKLEMTLEPSGGSISTIIDQEGLLLSYPIRLDKYGSQAACVKGRTGFRQAERFCYCKKSSSYM